MKGRGGFVGKLDGLKASEWKKCRCHQKIRQRPKKKKNRSGDCTSHALLFYVVHVEKRQNKDTCQKNKTKTENLIFLVHFSVQPLQKRWQPPLLLLLSSIIHRITNCLVLLGRCASRLKEPAAGSGPVPPCCGGTTKCRQSLRIFFMYIYSLFI